MLKQQDVAENKRKCEEPQPESASSQKGPMLNKSKLEVFHIGGDSDAEEAETNDDHSVNYPFLQLPAADEQLNHFCR